MAHYITTHNSKAEAVYSDKVPSDRVQFPTPIGTMELIATTHSSPVDVSTDSDIDQFAHDRENGIGTRMFPENGTAVAWLNFKPTSESPMHRTLSFDVVVVVDGVLELHLDSGEKRTLKAGDSAVQRAVSHKWVNVTPNDGWAKMVAFTQPIAEPLEIGGKALQTEWSTK